MLSSHAVAASHSGRLHGQSMGLGVGRRWGNACRLIEERSLHILTVVMAAFQVSEVAMIFFRQHYRVFLVQVHDDILRLHACSDDQKSHSLVSTVPIESCFDFFENKIRYQLLDNPNSHLALSPFVLKSFWKTKSRRLVTGVQTRHVE